VRAEVVADADGGAVNCRSSKRREKNEKNKKKGTRKDSQSKQATLA